MPASIFAVIMIKRKKSWFSSLIGILWLILQSVNPLIIGINTLSQILFGIQIGLWIVFTFREIIDREEILTSHFRGIIRGRKVLEIRRGKTLFTLTSFLSFTVYYLTNLIFKELGSDKQ